MQTYYISNGNGREGRPIRHTCFGIEGSREALEISPNLWAGVGLVRGGAGTALVGDPETVATRMMEYSDLGIETFILSGYPHLEEAYRVAELLFPHLPLEHQPQANQQVLFSPFGEVVANDSFPQSSEQKPVTTVD